MNSNNQNTQDYYNLPRNSSAPQQILNNNNNENNQHTLINNVGVSDTNLNTLHINNINSTILAPYNTTFEFYFHLPNDTRIYRVTYSELNLSENVQLLNNGINIQQQVQHSIVYQQINTQQQSFDTTHYFPSILNNDTYNTAANGTVSYDMQIWRYGIQEFSLIDSTL
ncbi:unnamed protein product [Rhizophagus irregularis]|nr:unnamed protein product [Rhizophagus irregularis]